MSIQTSFSLEEKLKEFFGYNTFRAYQKEIIQTVLNHQDVLAILPTGAGKSLCYQLPAMLMPGTAVVISPLISLMQDQVTSLFKNGIPAAFLNSSLYYQDVVEVLRHLSDYKLIYVAPERFADASFVQRLKEIPVSFFVIDEAHCISQWGHSFRSEYRKLSILKETFPDKPIMALTATATKEVEKDIASQLVMKQPVVIKGSFDRQNLTIRINQKVNQEAQLSEFLESRKSISGIIYAATRKTVDSVYLQLKAAGFNVGRYHAGMSDAERATSQNNFLYDKVTWMVATVAFGMGIHKPDIRFIVHLDMPKTIEQYYQEIGRAGRDGLPAECLMLYSSQELVVYRSFLDQVEDLVIRQQIKIKTDKMYALCTTQKCRRKELLAYFGEQASFSTCGSCDNCVDDVEMINGTIIAQKILSCVFRLNQNFGIRTVTDVLRGSKQQTILSRGFDRLSTYGLLTELSEKEVRYYIESLIHHGLLVQTPGDYPVLQWTEATKKVIKGQEQVLFRKKIFKESKSKEAQVLNYHGPLFTDLKQLRWQTAQEEGIPPYVVFSDRSLQEMATYFPKNQKEFAGINGVGPIKWMKYGEKFLEKIMEHERDHNREHNREPDRSGYSSRLPAEKIDSPVQRKGSLEGTVYLYQLGHSIEEITQMRQLAKSTILTHLSEAIEQGVDLDVTAIVSKDHQDKIHQVIALVGAERLGPIKERLSECSYDEIRLIVSFYRR